MSTSTSVASVVRDGVRPTRASLPRQILAMTGRGLLRIRHDPQRLLDVVAMPLLVIVIVANVFGGAIMGSTDQYLPHVIPGILVQVALTASIATGIQLREDLTTGVADRFRSLPISRVAPLAGTLLADVVRYALSVVVGVLTALAIGYRPDSWSGFALGCLLVILYAFAASWVFALIGVTMRSTSAIQGAAMLVVTPLTMMSSALVPVETMPEWLRPLARGNPITQMADATRALAQGTDATAPVLWSLTACLILLAIAAPLTVRAYVRRI